MTFVLVSGATRK